MSKEENKTPVRSLHKEDKKTTSLVDARGSHCPEIKQQKLIQNTSPPPPEKCTEVNARGLHGPSKATIKKQHRKVLQDTFTVVLKQNLKTAPEVGAKHFHGATQKQHSELMDTITIPAKI